MRQKLGLDYIGLVNYWKVVRDFHPKGYALGVLVYASGWRSGMRALRNVLKKRACDIPAVRVSGIWHDNHNFDSRDIRKAKRIARRVGKLADQYPCIDWYYQPWLEPSASKEDMTKCCTQCRKVLPHNVRLVTGGIELPNRFLELHHSLTSASHKHLFSFDGLSMSDCDPNLFKQVHKNARIFFGWIWECNGKKDKYDATPRHKRKNWLTASDIVWMKKELEK